MKALKLNVFSLRIFKLHIDQVQKLKLDNLDLDFVLADVSAVRQWYTIIDKMDAESVVDYLSQEDQQIRCTVSLNRFLSSNMLMSTFEYVTNSNANFSKRVTSLWLLDFDACSTIMMKFVDVRMASKLSSRLLGKLNCNGRFVREPPYHRKPPGWLLQESLVSNINRSCFQRTASHSTCLTRQIPNKYVTTTLFY